MINYKHQKCSKKFSTRYKNLEDLFIFQYKKNRNKDFLFFPDQNLKLTYHEFFNEYKKIALIFKSLKLKKSQRISIVFYNDFDFIRIYFAALSLGIVVVPINPDLSSDEIEFIVNNSGSKLVVYCKDIKKKISGVKNKKSQYIIIDQFLKVKLINRNLNPYPKVKSNDVAVIIYTSGTTGNPKGVVVSHNNIISDSYAISKNFKFNRSTRTLCILPLFHNNGQVATFFSAMYVGGSNVITFGKANILNFWNYVNEYKVTWTSVMASICSILLSIQDRKKNNSLTSLLCGGQKLNEEVRKDFEDRFKVPIFDGYGLTETTSFSCINRFPASKRVANSIGKELDINEMGIFEPEKFIKLPAGKVGEICIRGYNVCQKYHNLDEQNKKSFYKGWFRSGDFGKVDTKGNFYFLGRKDSLIIKGGENIYPAEIENALYKIKYVEECAVIGIPDKLLGENICAFVKIKNKTKDKQAIYENLGKYLAGYKLPKEIFIINNLKDLNEIPKGPTKKILYRELKRYYESKDRN